ncbi:MAG: hypothetical protein V2A77_03875 [Pseudomonadota bacterium]
MRIAIPVFHSVGRHQSLVLADWDGRSLLGATIDAVRAAGDHSVHVGSDSLEVLSEARRHGAEAVHEPSPRLTERFLPLGSLDLLRRLGPIPLPTAVLWPGLPTLRRTFLDRLATVRFEGGLRLALTVAESVDHPCQLTEAVHLLAAAVYFPLRMEPGRLASDPFPFHWPGDAPGRGRLFLRHVEAHDTRFEPADPHPASWPAAGVIERLSSSAARLLLPLETNTFGIFISAAATPDQQLGPLVRMLRHLPSGRRLLSLDHNMAQSSGLTVKLWTVSTSGLIPVAPSGVCLDPARATEMLDTPAGPYPLFPIPDPGGHDPWVLWLVDKQGRGSLTNVLIPWESSLGGWRSDIDSLPVRADDGWRIHGRQDFPPVYEFDSTAAVFAPGPLPETEPPIRFDTVTAIPLDGDRPRPVRHRLDLCRLRRTTQSDLPAEPPVPFAVPETSTEPDKHPAAWEDIRLYANVLGGATRARSQVETWAITRSMRQVCQMAMADRETPAHGPIPNGIPPGYRLEEIPGAAALFPLDKGQLPLFALPEAAGGLTLTIGGPGQVVRFTPEGERVFTLKLDLNRYNNAFFLCRSHLEGGVTLFLNQYDRILDIDASGRVVGDRPMPLPYMVAAHYDPVRERYHACSGTEGVCAVFNPHWKLMDRYQAPPEPLGYKTAMRLFHDPFRELIWVVFGALEAELPLTLVAYDLDGRFGGRIVHPSLAGVNAVSCVDRAGVFHVCCKRTAPVSFTAQGRHLPGPLLPTCCSLQVLGDDIWAVTRYGRELKHYRIRTPDTDERPRSAA